VFTEPLFRNGLHNPAASPLLGTDYRESSFIYCCILDLFTELLPGNALIKSATVCSGLHVLCPATEGIGITLWSSIGELFGSNLAWDFPIILLHHFCTMNL
jgi:hypothetical protein